MSYIAFKQCCKQKKKQKKNTKKIEVTLKAHILGQIHLIIKKKSTNITQTEGNNVVIIAVKVDYA